MRARVLRMRSWVVRHWRWVVPVAVAFTAFAAWLVFGVFAFHLVFVDDVVDEAPPLFASQMDTTDSADSATTDNGAAASPDPGDGASTSTGDGVTTTSTAPTSTSDTTDNTEGSDVAPAEPGDNTADAVPAEPGNDETGSSDDGSAQLPDGDNESETEPDLTPVPDEPVAPPTTEPAEVVTPTTEPPPTTVPPTTTQVPEIVTEASGTFVSRSHPTSGSAVVLGDGTGQRFLRFEDFETDNGPDLDVYLSTAATDAPAGAFDDDFVNLGDLKGNIGAQNYEIPRDVDLGRYSTVVIWCVRFAVVFGVAALT